MKRITIALLLLNIGAVYAQKPLKKQLWDFAQSCQSALEDGEEKFYEKRIDDAANGYLHIAGSFPTCGCACEQTVGAYKDSRGQYTLLSQEKWSCEQSETIKSNQDLRKIFPADIDFKAFAPNVKNLEDYSGSHFQYHIQIPQKGTLTQISISPIIMGKTVESNNTIVWSSASKKYPTYLNLYKFAQEIENNLSIQNFAKGSLKSIPKEDMEKIKAFQKSNQRAYPTLKDLQQTLHHITQTYELFLQIEHESLTFKWDRNSASFKLKTKGKAPLKPKSSISLRDFLLQIPHWQPMC